MRPTTLSGDTSWLESFILLHQAFLWVSIMVTVLSAQSAFQRPKFPAEESTASDDRGRKQANPLLKADRQSEFWTSKEQSTIGALFCRYDLDNNNVIDTIEELEQVSLNIVSQLEIRFTLDNLQRAIGDVAVSIKTGRLESPMDVAALKDWLWNTTQNSSFLIKREPSLDDSRPLVTFEEAKSDGETSCSHGALLKLLFPAPASNYPDSFARVYIPVVYAICVAVAMFDLNQ